MRRSLALTTMLFLGLLIAPAAASAGSGIEVNRGIAGVHVGDTPAEVREAVGSPTRRINGRNKFGPFTRYIYARRKLQVLFQGRRNVSLVSTTNRRYRTGSGVGVGSDESSLRGGVRNIRCDRITARRKVCSNGAGRPGQRLTTFFLTNNRVTQASVGIVID
jgi:hypothetical protein